MELRSGIHNGQKWIAGQIPMKQNLVVEIDTRTGKGVQEVLNYLKDFIRYQASHMNMSYHTTEDLIQELTAIALSAIPEYSLERKANMLTFLQNHVKNRIINLYKFTTEKCRTATHENFRYCKVKCPQCSAYTIIDEIHESLSRCPICRYRKQAEEKWKKYPIPIPFISSDEEIQLVDGSSTTIREHTSEEDVSILTGAAPLTEDRLLNKLSINSIISSLDETTQRILALFLEGHSMQDIAKSVKLSSSAVKARIQALGKNNELVEALGRSKNVNNSQST